MSDKNKKIKYPDEFVDGMSKYVDRLSMDSEKKEKFNTFLRKSSSKLLDIETAASLMTGWLKENVPETNENIREETYAAVKEARKLSKKIRERKVLKNTKRLYSVDLEKGNVKEAISTIAITKEIISYADAFSKKEFFSKARENFKESTKPTPAGIIRSFSKSEGIIRGHLEMARTVKTLKKGGRAVIYDPLISLFSKENPSFRDKFLLCLHTFLKDGGHLDLILETDCMSGPFSQLVFFMPVILSDNVDIYVHNGIADHEKMPLFLEMDRLFAYGVCSEENIDLGRGNVIFKNMATKKIREQYERILSESVPTGHTYLPERRREYLSFFKEQEIFLNDVTAYKSTLPLFTMKGKLLKRVLSENGVSEENIEFIMKYRKFQKNTYEKLLENHTLTIFFPDYKNDSEDKLYPIDLSGILFPTKLSYSREDFEKHLAETIMYSDEHPNFNIKISDSPIANSLEAALIGDDSLIITKPRDPATHLVVRFET